jgi:hypothetical protein
MKVALFSQRITDKMGKKKVAEKFEWFLFKVFLTAFIIMIAAQAALLYPSVRSSVSDYYIEGDPLEKEAYLFVPSRMELKLINIDNCPDLKVLVNGIEKETFENNSVLLELKDGDVVELDASSLFVPAKIQISAVSENISGLLGKTIFINDGITLVAKVKTPH